MFNLDLAKNKRMPACIPLCSMWLVDTTKKQVTQSDNNNSVSETRNLHTREKALIIFLALLLIYGLIIAPNIGTRLSLLGILAFMTLTYFSKKVLVLTLTSDALTLKRRSTWNYFRTSETRIQLNELGRVRICGFVGGDGGHFIELTYKNNKQILLRYIDIKNRAAAIKLIKPFLEAKSIKLLVYTDIYDPASETLKEIIEKKYNTTPNKFRSDFRFNGTRYELA